VERKPSTTTTYIKEIDIWDVNIGKENRLKGGKKETLDENLKATGERGM